MLNISMKTAYVRVVCDITCKWGEEPPRYRVYVNDELFAERTWIWKDVQLEESLQIEAPFGAYPVRFENVDPDRGSFKFRNIRVEHGPGRIRTFDNVTLIEVHDEG